jgi:hypothetical protein
VAVSSVTRRELAWLSGPVIAVLVVTALVYALPTSGVALQIRWSGSVDAAQRQSLERRVHLINATFIEGTRWGYILDDTSPANVAAVQGLPGDNQVTFLEGDPPRAVGPAIIRMAGPLAVQSYICLALGLLMLTGSAAPTRGWRQSYFVTACIVFIAAAIACELPVRAGHEIGPWMGDYTTYTEDRAHFRDYFGYEVVRFHFHLGGFALNLLDRALGATASSPETAFLLLSWLAGVVFLAGASAVAILEGWTPHVMRYTGLVMAAPVSLSFFGYRELGYLSLSAAAFPLLVRGFTAPGIPRRMTCLASAAVVQGLRAALYGFGLVSLGGSLLTTLAAQGPLRLRLQRFSTVFVWGFSAYLIWLLVYLLILGLEIVPGHASGIPFRSLLEPYVAENRHVAPILSARGLRDVGLESLVVGVPMLVLGLAVTRDAALRRIAGVFAVSSVIVLLLFWPAQGIGVDVDAVFAVFPAFFAGAWLCARNVKIASVALGTLAIAHGVFWMLVRYERFLSLRV